MKPISNYVEDLKHYTHTSISNIQQSKIPVKYDLNLQRSYNVRLHGIVYPTMTDIYLTYTADIPYTINQKRHTFDGTMDELYRSGEVQPFLLFINRRFIKWSDIHIVKDHNYSYIVIKNIDENIYATSCILLPCNIAYKENVTDVNMFTEFAFDSISGLEVLNTDNSDLKTIIDILDSNIETTLLTIDDPSYIDTNVKYPITHDNIVIFNKNGYLAEYINIETLDNMVK
ncbi:MAG: hypothetical protein ACRCXT_02840, partial [Paraclostridium sp.]